MKDRSGAAGGLDVRLHECNLRFAAVRSSGELREPSKVARVHLHGADEPLKLAMADRLARMLDDSWMVDDIFGKPTMLISVTGGAQDFKMLPRVQRVFREGLVRAAQITNAWVFTGGMASGVMKHVGHALAAHPDIPLIGTSVFGNVVGRTQIERKLRQLAPTAPKLSRAADSDDSSDDDDDDDDDVLDSDEGEGAAGDGSRARDGGGSDTPHSAAEGEEHEAGRGARGSPARRRARHAAAAAPGSRAESLTVDYVYTEALNTPAQAALEPHHTHFLLMDTGHAGARAWGGEIELGLDVQLAYARRVKEQAEAQRAERRGSVAAPPLAPPRRDLSSFASSAGEGAGEGEGGAAAGGAAGVGGSGSEVHVPAVLLVVQGGPNTLQTVVFAVERNMPVVVVGDSLGAASAIRDFLTREKHEEEEIEQAAEAVSAAQAALARAEADVASTPAGSAALLAGRKAVVRTARNALERALHHLTKLERLLLRADDSIRANFSSATALGRLRTLHTRRELIEVFELEADSTTDISRSILSAVARDPALPTLRLLELAVKWDHPEMVAKLLARPSAHAHAASKGRRAAPGLDGAAAPPADSARSGGLHGEGAAGRALVRRKRESMAAALQLALELQRAEVVSTLLAGGADVRRIALSRLYMLAEKNRFRAFASLQGKVVHSLNLEIEAHRSAAASAAAAAAAAGGGPPKGGAAGAEVPSAAFAGVAPVEIRRALRSGLSIPLPEEGEALRAAEAWMLRAGGHFAHFIDEWLSPEHHQMDFFSSGGAGGRDGGAGGGAGRLVRLSALNGAAPHPPSALNGGGAVGAGDPHPLPPLAHGPSAGHGSGHGGSASELSTTPAGAVTPPASAAPKPAPFALLASSAPRAHAARQPLAHARAPPLRCRLEDVFYWSVLMGDELLAEVLWRFSKQHLRLALLAAEIANRLAASAQGRKHRAELERIAEHWSRTALDLLEHVRPAPSDKRTVFHVAEAVLKQPVCGVTALELAMALRAKSFTAHRYCALITARRWAGHGHAVRLVDDSAPPAQVLLKAVLPFGWATAALGTRWVAAVEHRSEKRAPAFHDAYAIPAVKFWARALVTHVGFALVLTLLIASTSISAPHALGARPTSARQVGLECAFAAWTLGLQLDWAATLRARRAWARRGLRPAWAWLDPLLLLCTATITSLRVAFLALAALEAPGFAHGADGAGEGGTGGHGRVGALRDVLTGWVFPLALSGASLVAFLRFVGETLMQLHSVGMLVIVMVEMAARNVSRWAAVMACLLVGFGLAFTALAPKYSLVEDPELIEFETDGLAQNIQFTGAVGPSFIPVWALFGDFSVNALEGERTLLPAVLLIVLLVVAQVLLLNLLIAMMTDTYVEVNAQAAIEWQYAHMLLVDYVDTVLARTPPPLNLLVAPRVGATRLASRAGGGAPQPPPPPPPPDGRAAADAQQQRRRSAGGARAPGTKPDTGNESRDETRAFYALAEDMERRAREDVGARVSAVARDVRTLQLQRLEDREAIHAKLGAIAHTLGMLRGASERVPRSRVRAGVPLHARARSTQNAAYKDKRAAVPDGKVPWEVEWTSYEPIEFTHASVLGAGAGAGAGAGGRGQPPAWADPADATGVDFRHRRSFEQEIVLSAIGRPLNPRGRTGTTGRGLLGKWGPNHAADPVVIRRAPARGDAAAAAGGARGYQVAAIKRADVGAWAIPGGMVTDGELAPEALRREFTEAAASHTEAQAKADLEDALDEVFASGGERVYEGYVDDPRNTDNAWMETTVGLFFIRDDALAERVALRGGSSTSAASWLDLSDELLLDDAAEPTPARALGGRGASSAAVSLYADHRTFLRLALARVHALDTEAGRPDSARTEPPATDATSARPAQSGILAAGRQPSHDPPSSRQRSTSSRLGEPAHGHGQLSA